MRLYSSVYKAISVTLLLFVVNSYANADSLFGKTSSQLFWECYTGDEKSCIIFTDRHYRIPWFEKTLARVLEVPELYLLSPAPGTDDQPVYYRDLINQSRSLIDSVIQEDVKKLFDNGFTDPTPTPILERRLDRLRIISSNISEEINALSFNQ